MDVIDYIVVQGPSDNLPSGRAKLLLHVASYNPCGLSSQGILGTEVAVEVKVRVTSRLLGPMRTLDPITMFTNKLANLCKQNTWPQLLEPIQCILGANFPNLFLSNKRETVKDPMKSIPFLPKNVPGVGCVM